MSLKTCFGLWKLSKNAKTLKESIFLSKTKIWQESSAYLRVRCPVKYVVFSPPDLPVALGLFGGKIGLFGGLLYNFIFQSNASSRAIDYLVKKQFSFGSVIDSNEKVCDSKLQDSRLIAWHLKLL